MTRTLRAMPALLRVGLAETVAYRAEFVIWMLTTTMPLVMLGLWLSVAAEGPFAGYDAPDFIAHYLAVLIVRNVTGSWVVWQINEEIRTGTLSMRLLRPIHPFAGYVATHLSAVPLRGLVALPFAAILLATSARGVIVTDPAQLALFAVSLAGAWVLTFAVLITIACVAFWIERSMGIFEVYLGVFAVLSGYLIPLALLPDWVQVVADASPFRYMLSAPVEILIGKAGDFHLLSGEPGDGVAGALRLVGIQAAWATGAVVAAFTAWRAGIRRFEAYGA